MRVKLNQPPLVGCAQKKVNFSDDNSTVKGHNPRFPTEPKGIPLEFCQQLCRTTCWFFVRSHNLIEQQDFAVFVLDLMNQVCLM